MTTRRGLFGWLAGALGLSASKVLALPVEASFEMPQLIITMAPDMADPSDQFIAQFYAKWQQRFKGPPPIILPHGMEVKVLEATGCTIQEYQGDYGWCIVGRTGAEAVEMLGQVAFGEPSDPIVGNVTHFKMLHQDVDMADWNAGAMTPNQAREVMGLPPFQGGD